MLAAAGNRQNNVKKAAGAKPREEKADGGALADVGEEDEAAESAETEKRPDSAEAGKSSAEEGPSNNGPVAEEEADQVEGLTPPCAHPPIPTRSSGRHIALPKEVRVHSPLFARQARARTPFPRIDLVHARSYFCAGSVAARSFCID